MNTQTPVRLASEDVIINAPLSYAGSAQRIMRLRRRADGGGALVAITVAAVVLIILAWAFVTVWYLTWGLLLVPYRLLRRGARKRKAEAMRHRELMGTIQGAAAANAALVVGGLQVPAASQPIAIDPPIHRSNDRIGDAEREHAVDRLREHHMVGRLSSAEFEDRLDLVHAAITHRDLAEAERDLPAGG